MIKEAIPVAALMAYQQSVARLLTPIIVIATHGAADCPYSCDSDLSTVSVLRPIQYGREPLKKSEPTVFWQGSL